MPRTELLPHERWLKAEAPINTHIVIERSHDGPWFHEQGVATVSFDQVVKDLATCEHNDPHKILHIDEASGTVRNVTVEVCEAVVDRAIKRGDTLHDDIVSFLESVGVEVPDLVKASCVGTFDDMRRWGGC